MGRQSRYKRQKTGDGGNKKGLSDGAAAIWKKEHWEETPINPDFIRYYQAQGLVHDGEWAAFQASCETPLPIAFRFNANVPVGAALERLRRGDFDDIRDAEPLASIHPQYPVKAPTALPWYPDGMAWKIGATKRQLKKHPHLAELNKWLTALNENGFISRQEAVSMIPTLLLDVNSEHAVLDSCAAPGSKTAQILEMVSAAGSLSNGFVIANDASPVRANNLTHQLNRLCLPSFIVTNHEAQHFPNLLTAENARLSFDRILCDVPCSGDGTVRKNSEIWEKWSTSQGVALHRLQLQIVQRSLQLLKPGGRIVYSTCSFNPLENEAVVAEILRQSGGTVSLVDVSDLLPGLIRRLGRNTWKVFDRDVEYSSIDDVVEASRKMFRASMFPPTEDELKSFNLDRCLRLMPHDQDTGGFFVAVLMKSASTVHDQPKATGERLTLDGIRKRLRNKNKGEIFFRIADFPEHQGVLDELVSTFGLSESFPIRQLWCRSSNFETIGRIYLVNKEVDSILDATYHCSGPKLLKIVHSGVLVFENSRRKNPRAPPYRISHGGASVLLPFLTKRIQRWPLDRFRQLLTEKKVTLNEADRDSNDDYGSILVVCELPESKLIATCWAMANVIEVMMGQSAIDCLISSLPSPPSSEQ